MYQLWSGLDNGRVLVTGNSVAIKTLFDNTRTSIEGNGSVS